MPEYLVPIEFSKPVNFNGVVRNRATEAPLPGSTVRVLNKCTNQVQEIKADAAGNFDFLLDCHCDYELLTKKSGFEAAEKMYRSGEINCNQFQPEANPVMEVGTVIKLENVYYDYNKFNIRSDAATDLDHLVDLMKKYPTLEIELGSHTDARGSDEYNAWLSQQRAEAAVKYIISKGVSKRRLKAKGYGESELVNGCVNDVECDDATHEQNRRTEIKITRLEEKGVRY